jgi:hypothetical protein
MSLPEAAPTPLVIDYCQDDDHALDYPLPEGD